MTMNEQNQPVVEFEHDDFDFETLEEELQVNQRCQALLNSFYQHLLDHGYDAAKASDLAYDADFYLRDYVVDFARKNIVRPEPGLVRRFAASWYITTTVDPEVKLLERHLEAIRELYRYFFKQQYISQEELEYLEEETTLLEYYRQRIVSFMNIDGDGYVAWKAECPAK
jgi:hypothetical protein